MVGRQTRFESRIGQGFYYFCYSLSVTARKPFRALFTVSQSQETEQRVWSVRGAEATL